MNQKRWEDFRKKIVSLQSDLNLFQARFVDTNTFEEFAHNLYDRVGAMTEIRIAGYISETIRKELERILKIPRKVKIICRYFHVKGLRDRRNLEALQKLNQAGAEVKVNDRIHARFLVGYIPGLEDGLLLIGSFDFTSECIGKERYDAGIVTKHPDLVRSAVKFFDDVWNDQGSLPLQLRYKTDIEKHFPAVEVVPPAAPSMKRQPKAHKSSISVSPPTVSLGKNDVFTVDITVNNIHPPGLFSYQLQVHFNKTHLEVISAEIPEGHFLEPAASHLIFIVQPGLINNTLGTISFAASLLAPEEGKIGNGTLCKVTFRGKVEGKSRLSLQDVILADPDARPYPEGIFDTNDGNVVIKP